MSDSAQKIIQRIRGNSAMQGGLAPAHYWMDLYPLHVARGNKTSMKLHCNHGNYDLPAWPALNKVTYY